MVTRPKLLHSTLGFIEELARNDDRQWFGKNKAAYQAARKDFEQFVAAVLEDMAIADSDLAGLKPKDCIFRIYRDMRFSKSKLPYKAHFGAAMGKNGRKSPFPNYYIHIEPGASFLGGGLYHPSGPVLQAVRQEIDYNWQDFDRILQKKHFHETFGNLRGAQLKTKPRGYDPNNPAIKYLKFKDLVVMHPFPDSWVVKKDFKSYVVEKFKVMKNFMDFLKMPIFDVV
jgi:uncharacterized protein (TIGR02453 family)